jgi:hypothetical protein
MGEAVEGKIVLVQLRVYCAKADEDGGDGDWPLSLCPESFFDMLVVPKVRLSTAHVQRDSAEIVNGAWLDFRRFWPLYAFGFTHGTHTMHP